MDSNKSIDLCILDVLKTYSAEGNGVTQKFIGKKLDEKYGITIGRKALSAHISKINKFFDNNNILGYGRVGDETRERKNLNNDEEFDEYVTNLYFKSGFSNEEVNLLMDSIIFSHHIPKGKRKELLGKLEYLADNNFKNKSKHIEVINTVTSQNANLVENIGIIHEAINAEIKISFVYNEYDVDKKLHPQTETTVIPYKIIAHNNHYYLICSDNDSVVSYRIDKITELKKLEKEYFDPNNKINIKEYLASHPYMNSGKSEYIRMLADHKIIGDVIDYFGDNIRIINTDDDTVEILLKSSEDDMYYWSLQYGDYVEILEPQELRYRIRNTVETMAKAYLATDEDRYQKAIDMIPRLDALLLHQTDLTGKTLEEIPNDICNVSMDHNKVNDYSFLGRLTNIKLLHMSFENVNDFSFFQNLQLLEDLSLSYTGFNDLKVLKDNKNLKKLSIQEDTKVKNMDFIYEMRWLKSVYLSKDVGEQIDVQRLKQVNPEISIDISNY